MQESESKAASDYDAVDSIGKNVTNSSLYGVNKKEKVKANLTSPEKSRLKNKMSIFVKEWFCNLYVVFIPFDLNPNCFKPFKVVEDMLQLYQCLFRIAPWPIVRHGCG